MIRVDIILRIIILASIVIWTIDITMGGKYGK